MAAAPYTALYLTQLAAVGVMLPFLPPALAERGLGPSEVAALLAAGSAVRIVAGPLGGRVADALGDARLVLAVCAATAALAVGGVGLASGFAMLLLLQVLLAVGMGPAMPLADAVALGAARGQGGRPGFDYGRVRGIGSLGFIAASAAAGWVAGQVGFAAALWLAAAALALQALVAASLPRPDPAPRRDGGGTLALLAAPGFRALLPVSGLIQGSHALYYGFASIHWQEAGLSAATIGLLWAIGVVAEVALFVWGRGLVERLGPVGLSLLAAGAAALRWAVLAETSWVPALAAVQVLHAATYAAQHLATMQVLLRVVPPGRMGTAQTLHASLGIGLPMGVLMLASGPLYAAAGAAGFWAMAGLALLSVPWALRLPR